MTLRVAINGFGRIGRLVFRALMNEKDVDVVVVNDLVPLDNLAYLLKYDTVHGTLSSQIDQKTASFVVDGKEVHVTAEKELTKLPWKEHNVDYVIESTGRFVDEESAKQHLVAGAKRVIISAPAKGNIPTFVMGVNHDGYNPANDRIVSNASCTTNCLAPIAKVLEEGFGIEEGLLTTVHAITSSQPAVDMASKRSFRTGRAGAFNIVPASTGAAKAVTKCIPSLEGKVTGMAFRVPVLDVSCVDFTVKLKKATSYDAICNLMREKSASDLKGILRFVSDPVVSSDFIGDSHSAIFDSLAGIALNERFYKVVAWYDNERGYVGSLVKLLKHMQRIGDR